MRLLNTETLQLHEFWDNDIPPYAILSHTWSKDEVFFQEIQSITLKTIEPGLIAEIQQKEGFQKIKHCAKIAAEDGYEWVWIDTCCIDKTSSSELSEAINSMFKWYKRSEVCYAYLSDYHSGHVRGLFQHSELDDSFKRCRWFTRGWTLQELIAPRNLIFLNSRWEDVGTKASQAKLVAKITGVDVHALEGTPLWNYTHAQRMSWASKRITTRTEDLAYCLLGIFDVNMPMLYGEGDAAFHRLQEVIISRSADRSLFAFHNSYIITDYDEELQDGSLSMKSLFAIRPRQFQHCNNIKHYRHKLFNHLETIAYTDYGTYLKLPASPQASSSGLTTALLNCQRSGDNEHILALQLRLQHTKEGRPYYTLLGTCNIKVALLESVAFELRSLYIAHYRYHEQAELNWSQPFDVVFSFKNLQYFKLQQVSDGALSIDKNTVRFEYNPRTDIKTARCGYLHLIDEWKFSCLLTFEAISSSISGRSIKLYVNDGDGDIHYQIKKLQAIISARGRSVSVTSDRQFYHSFEGEWGLSIIVKRKRVEGKAVFAVTITEEKVN